jgi:hypothetical protein
MRHGRRPLAVLVVLAVLLVALAAPGAALAADPVTVTGTVMRDGGPVVGVEVVVTVVGGDVIASTATDEQGAFAVELEAALGDELEVFATGQTSRTGPDSRGCVRSETPVGEARGTVDALPPAPIAVELDRVLTSTVCTATGRPGVTPPSTDRVAGRPAGSSGGGLLLVLGVLALAGGGSLALVRRRG